MESSACLNEESDAFPILFRMQEGPEGVIQTSSRTSASDYLPDASISMTDVTTNRPAVPARDPAHRVRHQAMDAAADSNFTGANQPDPTRPKVVNGLARPSCADGTTFGRWVIRIEFCEQYERARAPWGAYSTGSNGSGSRLRYP